MVLVVSITGERQRVLSMSLGKVAGQADQLLSNTLPRFWIKLVSQLMPQASQGFRME